MSKAICVSIDGVRPTNTEVKSLKCSFNLNQCFCSCSLKTPYSMVVPGLSGWSDRHWITVEEHYPDCPNADPARYIGPVKCATSEK